jgi:hypothetical protein
MVDGSRNHLRMKRQEKEKEGGVGIEELVEVPGYQLRSGEAGRTK